MFEQHYKNELHEIDTNRLDWERRYKYGKYQNKPIDNPKEFNQSRRYWNISLHVLFVLIFMNRLLFNRFNFRWYSSRPLRKRLI